MEHFTVYQFAEVREKYKELNALAHKKDLRVTLEVYLSDIESSPADTITIMVFPRDSFNSLFYKNISRASDMEDDEYNHRERYKYVGALEALADTEQFIKGYKA